MTDELVKRLRSANDESFVETLCGEAADRIEALTAERDRLRAAIETISYYNTVGYTDMALDAASAALKGETNE